MTGLGRLRGRAATIAAVASVLASACMTATAWAQSGSVIAVEPRETGVVAHGSTVVWSSWQERRQEFRLKALVGNRVRTLAVRGRSVPFDVDLGPGEDGTQVAVYSRCRVETGVFPGLSTPNYAAGRGCRIFRYDFATKREARVAGTHERGASEYLPTIWRTLVAWARRTESRPTRSFTPPPRHTLYSRRLKSEPNRRSVALKGGTRDLDARPTSLDLRGSHLVFAWGDVSGLFMEEGSPDTSRCPERGKFDVYITETWAERIGGPRELVERACDSETPSEFRSVSLTSRGLVYLADFGLVRLVRADGSVFAAPTEQLLLAVAQSSDGLVASRWTADSDPENPRVEIVRLPPLRFAPVPRAQRPLNP